MREFAVTWALLNRDIYDRSIAKDDPNYRGHLQPLTHPPVPPEGLDWDLRGVAVDEKTSRVLWYWQRNGVGR